jgi:ribosomal protein S18 acetylase RimI-like enzyme
MAKSPELGTRSSLGGLLFDPTLDPEALKTFALRITADAGPIDLAPLNGHMNLGLSHPAKGIDGSNISFLCAPTSAQTEIFLRETSAFEICREQYALLTKVDDELKSKTDEGALHASSRGFSTRPLSVVRYKRDIEIYNSLVNAAMSGHANFYPLTFEEEWDILKEGLAVFVPAWFRFLTHNEREIGFCFAVPDYNSSLRSTRNDAVNALEILRQRVRGKWTRARLVYSGIHPDYQGQGLFKAVRHKVIQEMIKSGVEEFESSYVDEANISSLKNVRSTGGSVSHGFHLFRSRPSVLEVVR